ncbi:MAG TPA: NAD(P)H-dependent oxidoreductase [Polyangiales bacterium]|nr:NAD(P)H-dependent oxidoreductase [Polyangiales bacterium]
MRLLLVYHSQSGNTAQLMAAVARGAEREAGIEVVVKRAFDTTLDDLIASGAVVFGSAEYNGYMSGALKELFDRTFEPAQGRVTNKPYACVVSAGNDGTFALQAIERIARGYPLKRVADPIIVVGPVDAGGEARCEELGETIAAGLTLGIF